MEDARIHALERFLHAQGKRILEKTPRTPQDVADLSDRQGRDTPRVACPPLSGNVRNRDEDAR